VVVEKFLVIHRNALSHTAVAHAAWEIGSFRPFSNARLSTVK
jgi:hypothetical protein